MVSNKIRHPKKRAFLTAYSETGSLRYSAQIAGIHRDTHYDWRNKDEEYRAAFEAAKLEASDRLEEEARRRAVEGVDDPVYYKGEQVGEIRRYSDTLLIFLLKGAMPDKYADRRRLSGDNPITLRVIYADA